MAMKRIGDSEISFPEPSHSSPFIMCVESEGFVDVDERLLCLHFSIEVLVLLLVEREEYDEDMVLMRTIYQKPCYSTDGYHNQVYPGYYKVEQLCPPSMSSKINATSPISLPSNPKSDSVQPKRLPTLFENSELEVLTLSSNTESVSEDGPDSELIPKMLPFLEGSHVKGSEFEEVATAVTKLEETKLLGIGV